MKTYFSFFTLFSDIKYPVIITWPGMHSGFASYCYTVNSNKIPVKIYSLQHRLNDYVLVSEW